MKSTVATSSVRSFGARSIMVIEDDREWAHYYENLLSNFPIEIHYDCVAAINRINQQAPSLILLDILLTGPTGFSLLSELQSYPELAKIPVIIISSIDLKVQDLAKYGVRQVLNKSTMHPQELKDAITRLISQSNLKDTAIHFNHHQVL